MPNLAALHFRSLTLVSSLLPSADCLDLLVVRVSVPMLLLAGRGVLFCSTLGRLMLPSAVHIGVYVVLHLLCGDWPSLWSIGPTMFLQVPAQHSWPLMLPHCSIASGCSYSQSLQFVFPHVTVLLAHHQFIHRFETLHKLNPRVSRLYNGVLVPSDTCLNHSTPLHNAAPIKRSLP